MPTGRAAELRLFTVASGETLISPEQLAALAPLASEFEEGFWFVVPIVTPVFAGKVEFGCDDSEDCPHGYISLSLNIEGVDIAPKSEVEYFRQLLDHLTRESGFWCDVYRARPLHVYLHAPCTDNLLASYQRIHQVLAEAHVIVESSISVVRPERIDMLRALWTRAGDVPYRLGEIRACHLSVSDLPPNLEDGYNARLCITLDSPIPGVRWMASVSDGYDGRWRIWWDLSIEADSWAVMLGIEEFIDRLIDALHQQEAKPDIYFDRYSKSWLIAWDSALGEGLIADLCDGMTARLTAAYQCLKQPDD